MNWFFQETETKRTDKKVTWNAGFRDVVCPILYRWRKALKQEQQTGFVAHQNEVIFALVGSSLKYLLSVCLFYLSLLLGVSY